LNTKKNTTNKRKKKSKKQKHKTNMYGESERGQIGRGF